MPTWLHSLLVGGINYWQGAIVKCGGPGMAGSVAEAQSHDEGVDGGSVTGIHGSVTGDIEHKCNWRDRKTSRHRSVTGACLYGLLECMVSSWKFNYKVKLNVQPVREWVTVSVY